jgi:hypothetical protein
MGWYYYGTLYSKERKRLLAKCVLTFCEDWEEFEIAHLATSMV